MSKRDKRFRHGMRQWPEYKVWAGMKTRCTNPKQRSYAQYGAKGVFVCDRWMKSFYAFIEDMGRRPSPQHSLDRIDSTGNYEPGNCRWSTPFAQNRNISTNFMITAFGKTQCLIDWARETGISRQTIKLRIVRDHLSAEEALAPGDRRCKNGLAAPLKATESRRDWLDYSFAS